MKVAQVVCVSRPYKGGIGEVAHYYCAELLKHGHDVTLFAPKYDGMTDIELIDGIKIERVSPQFSFGNAAIIADILPKLRGFDVVHLHYPFFGGALFAMHWKRQNPDKKLVITYHMDVFASGWKGMVFSLYRGLFLSMIMEAADKIIVSSMDYAEHSFLKKLGSGIKSKLYELGFGVDALFENKIIDNSQAALTAHDLGINIPDEMPKILFVGGLDSAHYFKGLENFLQSMHELNAHAIIVGKGDCKKYFEDVVAQNNLQDKVTFTGFVSDDQLVDLYDYADIFCLPSTDSSEAFGIVSVQAMSRKKPVVTTNLPGVRAVVGDQENGLLAEPNDVVSLTRALQALINDPALCKKLGEAGYKKFQKKYRWEFIGKDLSDLYKNL
jgi:glycosyltransferase involved in cell wall biosynthesis